MLTCPRCNSYDVARWPGVQEGQHNHHCRNCGHTWATIEVLEEYLHNLISRSLELAALKSNLKEPS